MSRDDKLTIWRGLDRKAGAISEFTIRQYRKKLSTWVVLGVGALAIALILLFYIDEMNQTIEAIDQDGDSYDWDGDGYPQGQERLWGTDPWDSSSHPGKIDSTIEPDPPEKWINEDDFDIDFDEILKGKDVVYTGEDSDGDCDLDDRTDSQKDTNNNDQMCDVMIYYSDAGDKYIIRGDQFVDEDPDEDRYGKEAMHRAFILAMGKMGFVFLLGIFLPLFLATGLIREEMTSGTMHYMLAKPISRVEVFLYRIIGYLGIVWPFIILMGVIVALISGFFGPGDSFFRFSDLGMWVAIIWATMLATLVYGMLFATLGVMWKHGIIIAIPFAAWELGMAIVSMNEPNASILNFSVIGWCLSIIDVAGEMVWPDQQLFIALGQWAGTGSNSGWWNSLPGAEPLDFFYSPSTYGIGLVGTLALCTTVLLVQASTLWFIGGQMFKGKEIE